MSDEILNKRMDEAIRRAAGYGSREPHPADTISPDDDDFTQQAKRAGVPADLLDVARSLVPEGLSGAALASALQKTLSERPGLATAGAPSAGPEGLDGGAGREARPRQEPDMNRLIRRAAGREDSGDGLYTNLLPRKP